MTRGLIGLLTTVLVLGIVMSSELIHRGYFLLGLLMMLVTILCITFAPWSKHAEV